MGWSEIKTLGCRSCLLLKEKGWLLMDEESDDHFFHNVGISCSVPYSVVRLTHPTFYIFDLSPGCHP